eukprot:4166653-Amphidinium_carterae.1
MSRCSKSLAWTPSRFFVFLSALVMLTRLGFVRVAEETVVAAMRSLLPVLKLYMFLEENSFLWLMAKER